MDLVILMESSSSLGQTNWVKMLSFVTLFVSGLTISPSVTRVAVVSYSNTVNTLISFTSYNNNAQLISAINNLQYSGASSVVDTSMALQNARTQQFFGARPDVPRVIVLLTSTGSTINANLALQEARRLVTISCHKY